MTSVAMRRINVYMDRGLDERTAHEARRRGISKAALIRLTLRDRLGTSGSGDPLDDLVGASAAEPAGDIDSVIYEG